MGESKYVFDGDNFSFTIKGDFARQCQGVNPVIIRMLWESLQSEESRANAAERERDAIIAKIQSDLGGADWRGKGCFVIINEASSALAAATSKLDREHYRYHELIHAIHGEPQERGYSHKAAVAWARSTRESLEEWKKCAKENEGWAMSHMRRAEEAEAIRAKQVVSIRELESALEDADARLKELMGSSDGLKEVRDCVDGKGIRADSKHFGLLKKIDDALWRKDRDGREDATAWKPGDTAWRIVNGDKGKFESFKVLAVINTDKNVRLVYNFNRWSNHPASVCHRTERAAKEALAAQLRAQADALEAVE